MNIINFKEINKGYLKARFDVEIQEWGVTIRSCSLFDKEGKKWICLPSQQYKGKDGSNKHFDYVVFEKDKKNRFQTACIEKINKREFQTHINNQPVTNDPF